MTISATEKNVRRAAKLKRQGMPPRSGPGVVAVGQVQDASAFFLNQFAGRRVEILADGDSLSVVGDQGRREISAPRRVETPLEIPVVALLEPLPALP